MDDRHSGGALSPERVHTLLHGHRNAALIGAAATHRFFTHLAAGAATVEELAARAGVAVRGAQALLDGLVAIGLVAVADGRYTNGEEAEAFLVEDRPGTLAPLARMTLGNLAQLAQLGEVVRTGEPVAAPLHEGEDHAFWHELVPAIAPMARAVAEVAARELDVARAGTIAILDVGGGSGAFAATLLRKNPEARATQLDGPVVNRIARDLTAREGVGDRFDTIDGDMRTADFGEARYDIVVYSNIAHGEPADSNRAIVAKMRRALRPGGTLVVSDFILENDRTGHPGVGTFHMMMLLSTRGGTVWRRADYEEWARAAGFTDVRFVPTRGPSTLVLAR